jgi:hypothetical protein
LGLGCLPSSVRWRRCGEVGGEQARITHVRAIKEMAQALRPQPEPGDERRDEQGKPEQLVGPGDDPNDRDDG